jgi:hypothetical protein
MFCQSYVQAGLPRTEGSAAVSHLSPSPGLVSKRRGYEHRSCVRITHKLVCPTKISDIPSRQKGVANRLKTCSRKRKGDSDDEAAGGSRQPFWELVRCSTGLRYACLSAGNFECSWSKLCSELRSFGSRSSPPMYFLGSLERRRRERRIAS